MKRLGLVLGVMLLIGSITTSCGKSGVEKIDGAGASFPYPLYTKMLDVYYSKTKIKVSYEAIGSGGGIKSILDRVVDFAGTDKPVSDKKLADTEGILLHVPTCLGAIVATYNLPGKPQLKLTSEVLSKIFLGEVKKWNDPSIAKLNNNIQLPDLDITIVHRSDGSGSTFVFTDYLSKVNSEWKNKVGKGKSVNWPTGVGQAKNAGVASYVKENVGSIGYVELAYANQNLLPVATLKNKSGNFIKPSIESVSLAANVTLPDDTRVSLTDTDAAQGYPLASFTWLLLYQEQNYDNRTKDQATELIKLIWWMTHDAQIYNSKLDYAPLPKAAVKKVEAILNSVVYNGKKVR